MPIPDCHLYCHASNNHLTQLFTGFSILHRERKIRLRQTVGKKSLGRFEESHLRVVLNGEQTLYYDMHDCGEILPGYLENVDLYFKRSYSEDAVANVAGKERIRPFGFNYEVFEHRFDRFAIARAALFAGGERMRQLVKACGVTRLLSEHSHDLANLEEPPRADHEPGVIFMARAWNPEKIENQSKRENVERINEERARCVGLLRKEFGSRFFGGLAVDDYSRRHFPEYLLPEGEPADQSSYLERLRRYPIGVATRGLCDSNGWKLAEYIAFSKAIVSEHLFYETVGDFADGRNYLGFTTPEECVEKVGRMFDDARLRQGMRQANYEYYKQSLRPDRIVMNTLEAASGRTL